MLVALESNVWEALRRGDAAADRDALAENFLGVYPTGFSDRDDHVSQLADGPTIVDFEIANPRVLVVSEKAVLLAYRANFRRVGQGRPLESMYVSSVWCRVVGGDVRSQLVRATHQRTCWISSQG